MRGGRVRAFERVLSADVTRRLYGLCLTSNHAFVNRVPVVSCAPELSLRYVDADPVPAGWDADGPVVRSPLEIREGVPFLAVYQVKDVTVFRFSEVVDFFLAADTIEVRLHDPHYAHMVELHLLGFVLSFWLERAGLPALHASAIAWPAGAVGFLATNKGGKSSLAAAAMQAGAALLSDDVLPIDVSGAQVRARESYPQMRMWRHQAAHFVADADDLERVHPEIDKVRIPVGVGGFGRFASGSRILRRLYLPVRGDDPSVRFEALGFAEAVAALARQAFLAGLVDGLVPPARRVPALARLAREVPVARLYYPSGMDRLPAVIDEVRATVGARSG